MNPMNPWVLRLPVPGKAVVLLPRQRLAHGATLICRHSASRVGRGPLKFDVSPFRVRLRPLLPS